MSHLTLYLDDKTEKLLRESAKATGISLSRFAAAALREKVAGTWPATVRNAAGSWKDFPDAEELRKNLGDNVPREEL